MPQLDLAEKYQSSRLNVRDALNRLESEGLVESLPNRGATVKRPNTKVFEENFGILARLEVYGAEIGLPCCTANDIDRLRELNKQMADDANSDNFLGYIENNLRFHVLLPKLGGNDSLVSMLYGLRERNALYAAHALSIIKHNGEYIHEHDLIIDACERKDLNTLKTRIVAHIQHNSEVILNYLSKL